MKPEFLLYLARYNSYHRSKHMHEIIYPTLAMEKFVCKSFSKKVILYIFLVSLQEGNNKALITGSIYD